MPFSDNSLNNVFKSSLSVKVAINVFLSLNVKLKFVDLGKVSIGDSKSKTKLWTESLLNNSFILVSSTISP